MTNYGMDNDGNDYSYHNLGFNLNQLEKYSKSQILNLSNNKLIGQNLNDFKSRNISIEIEE